MRTVSLTSEAIAVSVAKRTADQQRSLDSLAKVVLDNRTDLDYLLAEQGGVCAMADTTAAPGLTLLGKLNLNYIRSLNKPLGLRR